MNRTTQESQQAEVNIPRVALDAETALKAGLTLSWLNAQTVGFLESLASHVMRIFDTDPTWRVECAKHEERFTNVMKFGADVTQRLKALEQNRVAIEAMTIPEQANYFTETVRPLVNDLRQFVRLIGGTFLPIRQTFVEESAKRDYAGFKQIQPEQLVAQIEQGGKLLREHLVECDHLLRLSGMFRENEANIVDLGSAVSALAAHSREIVIDAEEGTSPLDLVVEAPEVLTQSVIDVTVETMRTAAKRMRETLRSELAHEQLPSKSLTNPKTAQLALLASDTEVTFRSPQAGALAIGIPAVADDYESLKRVSEEVSSWMSTLKQLSSDTACSVHTQVQAHPTHKDLALYECVLSFAVAQTPADAESPRAKLGESGKVAYSEMLELVFIPRTSNDGVKYKLGLSRLLEEAVNELPPTVLSSIDEVAAHFPGQMYARVSPLEAAVFEYGVVLEAPTVTFEASIEEGGSEPSAEEFEAKFDGDFEEEFEENLEEAFEGADGAEYSEVEAIDTEARPGLPTGVSRQYLVLLTDTTAREAATRHAAAATLDRLEKRLRLLASEGTAGLERPVLSGGRAGLHVPNVIVSAEALADEGIRERLARIFKRVLPGSICLPPKKDEADKLLAAVEVVLEGLQDRYKGDDRLRMFISTPATSIAISGMPRLQPRQLSLQDSEGRSIVSAKYNQEEGRFELAPVPYATLESLADAVISSLRDLRQRDQQVKLWRLGQELHNRGFEVFDRLLIALTHYANLIEVDDHSEAAARDQVVKVLERECRTSPVAPPRRNGDVLELYLKEEREG